MFHEGSHAKNWDALITTEYQQVAVSTHDVIDVATDSAFQHTVIVRIVSHDVEGFSWRDDSFKSASATIAGIELAHRIRKKQYALGHARGAKKFNMHTAWQRALFGA
jgi:hypothetical protein